MNETELMRCREAFEKWAHGPHKTVPTLWKAYEAGVAQNRRSPEPDESRSGEVQRKTPLQHMAFLPMAYSRLEKDYLTLEKKHNILRSGVEKVRDEMSEFEEEIKNDVSGAYVLEAVADRYMDKIQALTQLLDKYPNGGE